MVAGFPQMIAIMAMVVLGIFAAGPIRADSTSPRLAAYYDLRLAICGDTVWQWAGNDTPKAVFHGAVQVAVGRNTAYALTASGALMAWEDDAPDKVQKIVGNAGWVAAGRSAVAVGLRDGRLLWIKRPTRWFGEGALQTPETVAQAARGASVGDSADYYIADDHTLHVRGLAHRGQYGDGRLMESATFIPVARNVAAIRAHTGHAILLQRDGRVLGTGGNIYGPVGRHGIGDKAVRWSLLIEGASGIATGSSHTLALRSDGTLWHWGRNIGLEPSRVLDGVQAAAADSSGSFALRKDGTIWQWDRQEKPQLHFRCRPADR